MDLPNGFYEGLLTGQVVQIKYGGKVYELIITKENNFKVFVEVRDSKIIFVETK